MARIVIACACVFPSEWSSNYWLLHLFCWIFPRILTVAFILCTNKQQAGYLMALDAVWPFCGIWSLQADSRNFTPNACLPGICWACRLRGLDVVKGGWRVVRRAEKEGLFPGWSVPLGRLASFCIKGNSIRSCGFDSGFTFSSWDYFGVRQSMRF